MIEQNLFISPIAEKAGDFKKFTACHSGDITEKYKSVDNIPLNVSLYFPKAFSPKCKYKTLLLIHGGSWETHKIFEDQNGIWQGDYLGFLARYYADKGFVCASIDYRIAEEKQQYKKYSLIDLYADCSDAVKHLYINKEKFGIDENCVFVLGESAGGYLAAALAYFPYITQSFKFKKAILVNSITSLHDYWGERALQKFKFDFFEETDKDRLFTLLSPLDCICKTDCSSILIHGLSDTCVSPAQSKQFHKKMIEMGNDSKLYLLPETGHAFLLVEYTEFKNATLTAVKVIDKELLTEIR